MNFSDQNLNLKTFSSESKITINSNKYDEHNNLRNEKVYDIIYMGNWVKIRSIREIKICGIWYCGERDRQYKRQYKLLIIVLLCD